VAAGNRFYLALNNSWEIEVHQLDGKLLRLIRVSVDPVRVTPAHIATYKKQLTEQMDAIPVIKAMPAIRAQMVARLEKVTYPEFLPFIEGLLLDADGNLWVREVQPPGSDVGAFAVLDSAGTLLGRVSMPARFRATAITGDAIYGVFRDSDDLPHVRVLPLRKGP
jgi:sugar lactone lactonase YvrE